MAMLRKLYSKLKEEKGVTLIELLAVIVILGIIAAIGIPAIMNSRDEAKTSTGNANAAIMTQTAKKLIFDGEAYAATVTTDGTQFDFNEVLTKSGITPAANSVTGTTYTADIGNYTLNTTDGTVTFAP